MDEKDIDSQKIRDLNDALEDLVGGLRVTEKAVESLVSRIDPAMRKMQKAMKENSEAADKNTETIKEENKAREKQLTDEEKRAKRQEESFKRQLESRNAELDATGKIISKTSELTAKQQEQIKHADALLRQSETQSKIKSAFEDAKLDQERKVLQAQVDNAKTLANNMLRPGAAITDMSGKFNSSGAIVEEFNGKITNMVGSSAIMAGSFIALKGVIGGVIDAASSMSKSLMAGERGAAVGAKAITEFANSVSTAATTIGAAMMLIPGLSIASKLIGGIIATLGWFAKKAAEVNEKAAEQNDKLFKSFNELSQSGLTTAEGMDGVYIQLQKLGMSVGELETFNALLKSNSQTLKLFGSTTSDGMKQFVKVAGDLVKGDFGVQLERLGVTAAEQREHTLKYMSQQTRMGLAQGKTTDDLIKGSKAYIEELDRITALTGASKKEQEDAREAILKIDQLRAAQYEAETKGDTATAKRLELAVKFASYLQQQGNVTGAKGVAELSATNGAPTSKDSAVVMQQFAEAMKAIKEGKSIEDVIMASSEGIRRQLKLSTTTAKYGGDVSGLQTGTFGTNVDQLRAQDLVQKTPGLSYSDALKRIQQQRQAAGNDGELDNNIDGRRKQQNAAMLQDNILRTFNASAKLNEIASSTFAAAVDKFADTVGAKKIAGGGMSTSGGGMSTSGGGMSTSGASRSPNESFASTNTEGGAAIMYRKQSNKMRSTNDSAAVKTPAPVDVAKIDKEIARFTSNNNMSYQANKDYVAGLEAKKATAPSPASAAKDLLGELKLKPGAHVEGSHVSPRLLEIAKKIQESVPGFTRITGLNDEYHQKNKPNSKHAKGLGIDFTVSPHPSREEGAAIVAQMQALGLYGIDEYNNRSPGSTGGHFHGQLSGARNGAVFNGSSNGYPVELHGREAVVPLPNPDSIIRVESPSVAKQPLNTVLNTSSINSGGSDMGMLGELVQVLSDKLDNVISALEDGNHTNNQILQYSRV